jgi:RNA recognition motif-containing protein
LSIQKDSPEHKVNSVIAVKDVVAVMTEEIEAHVFAPVLPLTAIIALLLTICLQVHHGKIWYVEKNISHSVQKDHFRKIGDVVFADVKEGHKGKYGIVEFKYYDDVKRAIRKLDNTDFMGGPIYISEDRPRRRRSRSGSRNRYSPYSRRRSASPRKRRSPSPRRRSRSPRNRSQSPRKQEGGNKKSPSKSPQPSKRYSKSPSPANNKTSNNQPSRSPSPGGDAEPKKD